MIGFSTLLPLLMPRENAWSNSWQNPGAGMNVMQEMQNAPRANTLNTMQFLQNLPGDAGNAGKLFSLIAGIVSGPDSQFRQKGSMYDLILNSSEQNERYKPRKDR